MEGSEMQMEREGQGLDGASVTRTNSSSMRRQRSTAASLSSRGNTGGGGFEDRGDVDPSRAAGALRCNGENDRGENCAEALVAVLRGEDKRVVMRCKKLGDVVDAAGRGDGADGPVATRERNGNRWGYDGRRRCFGGTVAGRQVNGKRAGWLAGLEIFGHPGDRHRVRIVRGYTYDLVVPRAEGTV